MYAARREAWFALGPSKPRRTRAMPRSYEPAGKAPILLENRDVTGHLLLATRKKHMALPFDVPADACNARGLAILAKTLYRELRAEGYEAGDVMALAGELLGLIASEVKDRRDSQPAEPPVADNPRALS